jgi:chromatin remodeling complex protein RSC6
MDYKHLLYKYIKHVSEEEGVTFIEGMSDDYDSEDFSKEERRELIALDTKLKLELDERLKRNG